MPLRQKLIVCAMFLLGVFVVIAGALRLWGIQEALTLDYNHTCMILKPSLYHGANEAVDKRAPAFYWSGVEAGTGVTSACLPTLRPIFSSARPRRIISTIREIGTPSGTKNMDSKSCLKHQYSHKKAAPALEEPQFDEFALVLDDLSTDESYHAHAEGLTSGGPDYPVHEMLPQSTSPRE